MVAREGEQAAGQAQGKSRKWVWPSRTVPVVGRERERRLAAEAKARAKQQAGPALSAGTIVLLILVVIMVLFAIAVPLRNFYEGRSEIARAQENIARLEERKAALETEIARFEDPAYVDEVARRRLGVIAPGEAAWRVLDPRMTQAPSITSEEAPDERSWPEVLWDSLREAPEVPEMREVPAAPEPQVPEAVAPEAAEAEVPEQVAPDQG